jgi:predicted acyltransferase
MGDDGTVSHADMEQARFGNRSSRRLMSLDLFRGITIAAMLLVNDPGEEKTVFWPLRHADWNGWTPTDLIFPFFLFIVGASMAFSIPARLRRDPSKTRLLKHVFWRGILLFAIGLLLNGMIAKFDFAAWRVYGVLQRIALAYVICAVLAIWSGRKTWIAATIACLAGYWILMRFVPVPGFGVPTRDVPLLDPDRNLAAWLDRKLLAGHLYDGTRDPEGLLSTVPAIATTLIGLLTGNWLQSGPPAKAKARVMALFGTACVITGELVSLWLPINKNLWTSSYAVFTAGLALIALAACYVILDVIYLHAPWAMPCLVFGTNAIAAYVFGSLLAIALYVLPIADGSAQEFIYQTIFEPLAPPYVASLLYALSFVFVCWIPMYLLYRKRIFLKI